MPTARKSKAVKFPTNIQLEEHFATKADIADVRKQLAKLETKMETKIANLETKMERQKTELIKWMVAIMGIFSSIIIAAIKL